MGPACFDGGLCNIGILDELFFLSRDLRIRSAPGERPSQRPEPTQNIVILPPKA